MMPDEEISAFAAYKNMNLRTPKKTKKKVITESAKKKILVKQLINQQKKELNNSKKIPKKKRKLNSVKEDPEKNVEKPDLPKTNTVNNTVTNKRKLNNKNGLPSNHSTPVDVAKKMKKTKTELPPIKLPKILEDENFVEEDLPVKIIPLNKEKQIIKDTIKSDKELTNNSKIIEVKFCTELTPHKNAMKSSNVNTSPIPKNDSVQTGADMFNWLINPITSKKFFSTFWEKAPFLVQRNDENYFSKLISFNMINKLLLDNHIEFTKNIDITSYKNGIRETLNPEGRAMPGVVWEKYINGCSIRLLNPQTFLNGIFTMNATLQEYFHCMVGANVYLTPPNSQGFAPHYDDIEAFVLQIEGRKHWKLYNPRSQNEELPRNSSRNFTQEEIGKPILEKILKPGDIMYFPRGTIHQATTEPGFHSLHITLSVYQKQTYADLFEKLLPMMLNKTIEENIEFRKGLPLNIWSNLGVVYSDTISKERNEIFKKCRDLLKNFMDNLPLDEAVDQAAKKFQHEALPPNLTTAEKCRTVFGCKNLIIKNGELAENYEINLESRVRLLRANILRLIQEDGGETRIYFYTDNSKEYQQYEPNFIEIEPDDASAVEVLIKSYPNYVYVKSLPTDNDEKKMCIVQALWDRGILMLSDPV